MSLICTESTFSSSLVAISPHIQEAPVLRIILLQIDWFKRPFSDISGHVLQLVGLVEYFNKIMCKNWATTYWKINLLAFKAQYFITNVDLFWDKTSQRGFIFIQWRTYQGQWGGDHIALCIFPVRNIKLYETLPFNFNRRCVYPANIHLHTIFFYLTKVIIHISLLVLKCNHFFNL